MKKETALTTGGTGTTDIKTKTKSQCRFPFKS